MVSLSCEVLVDQVEWIPAEENSFVKSFRLSVGCEGLVTELVDVQVNSGLEAFLLHPLAAIACECE